MILKTNETTLQKITPDIQKEVIHLQNQKINEIKKSKKTIRCHYCRKKLLLMEQIKCQCNYLFCSSHLNRHSHNCTFNNQKVKKDEIRKDNPKLDKKFEKI